MYLGLQGLRVVVQVLPLAMSRALGRGLGLFAYRVLGAQRCAAMDHLEYALGDAYTPSQRDRITRGVFLNLGANIVEWLALPRLSTKGLQRLVRSEGVDHLRTALAQGHGAIVITPHFGNWEYISPYLRTLGFEGGVLARPLRYPEYESLLINLRAARGIQTLMRGSTKEAARLLQRNQVLGLLPDQDIDSLDGIFVDFFGHPAHTPVGPATLSVMTGAPIVPCFMIREGSRFRLVITPALSASEGMDRTQAAVALTKAWSQVFETYIRRHPHHWVWMHRRWKTRPADEAPWLARVPIPKPKRRRRAHPVLALAFVVSLVSLVAVFGGCGKPDGSVGTVGANATTDSEMGAGTESDAQMSAFKLTGYKPSGEKRWELSGRGAVADGDIITILEPDGIGYDESGRATYLTAGAAQVDQTNQHVRMEYEVTVHTSDGLWLTAPVLHWMPEISEVATDTPVRIETDHMLIRGRGLRGRTELKQSTIFTDVELVLNPGDDELPGERTQVIITCDGPLTFDYENNVAIFENNVHVQDPRGDLYSDKLVAYLDETSHTIRYAEAIGRVRMEQFQNTALSERAIYEPAIGKITLVGQPSLLVYPDSDGGDPTLAFGGLAPDTP